MTNISSRFDADTKALEIARERERFMAASVGFVMVKTAPWSGRKQIEFGSVDIHEIHDGVCIVAKADGADEPYPDLNAMLEDWIGD
jgi:hypothetical protein